MANSVFAEDARFINANELFTQAKFQEAAIAYEEILNSGVESGGVYYNLGNAYYKTGNLPKAILNYERALLMLPHDKDIRYNLEMANSQITDKLDTVDEFFIINWYHNFKNSTKSDTWALISILGFILSLTSIAIFLFSRPKGIKQISFFMGIILFLISLISFNFSANQKDKLTNRNSAIIFTPSVTIKSSPSASGTELFILHEGTKVRVIEKVSNWYRIQISDGNEGWAPEKSMEII
jgi:tetratricopeptide (TPR) repeat protein